MRSYLFAIARNLIRDNYRRARVRQSDGHMPYDDEIETVEQSTPEDILSTQQALKNMRTALKGMKRNHRRAFLLSRFRQLSYREIADDLGVSVSSVERYITTVLCALRKVSTL